MRPTPAADDDPVPARDQLVARGRAALQAADWVAAERAFAEARQRRPGPDALEGLGKARYWQGHHAEALDLLATSHREHREAGNARAAAGVAIHLAQLHALVNGDGAAMQAWVGHAHRMLDRHGAPCRETGWVEVFRACISADPAVRHRRATRAVELGRRFDDPALEFDALAYLGQAEVEQGRVERGMALLDEAVAAATAGLVDDPWAVGEIWCTLFHACELVGEVHRAEQWLDTVDGYVTTTGERPIRGICRTHWGGVLTSAGRWEEAALAFEEARDVFSRSYRPSFVEPTARLADLRIRQGRLEQAARLMAGFEDHPAMALPRGRLALSRGRPAVARDVVVRAVPETATLADTGLVELAIVAQLASGHGEEARGLHDRLERLAATTGHPAVLGRSSLAAARIAVASGDDPSPSFGAALSALATAGLPWELGVARLEYATWLTPGEPELAREHARHALDGLARLGAADADRAGRLLRSLGESGRPQPRTDDVLTARQQEVLTLVSEGLSNAQVADRLHLSPRTVEDHVGNILQALGVDSRTAAAAWAARHVDPD
ncbi:LuxR C-terminal-related transcriptional regulator [Salsipaludibacter albus]|uniref:LuxR C-terminal-related transcriptional regulator n=1 Tax=Salsipaludibacter albus TaxID=2849650 RepID=UPI001EE499CB|nr:LuxR C-terminal-related transcriptional regulator [Salsipaludibacter albus]MBY5161514.1 LuxR C-terminal-related transcriptional regulator [Salsipaludibacter albus]